MVKCYECKDDVEKETALKFNISKSGKHCNRYFHPECHEIFQEKRQDNNNWNDLYEYIKHEILKYTQEMSLPTHLIRRLKGIRSGQYVAQKGTSSLSKNGYPYKVILMTFKVKKVDILYAISNQSKFKTEKHQIDYIMAIIQNSINDVYLRIKEKKESDKKLIEKDFSDKNYDELEYVNNSDIKKNKVANMLDHLW